MRRMLLNGRTLATVAIACSLAATPATAQSSGAVEVSVQIVPAPTFVSETARSAANRPAVGLSTLRVVGAATCRVEADVAGERVPLGACGEDTLLSSASQRLLNTRAHGQPIRLTVTLDAGT
ncbi:MAG: hypothetical protein SFW08_01895 [Gemmatimonadaceae bacterium]|nr:hypothetical protein [Gemmatimonadaceae bacterium]